MSTPLFIAAATNKVKVFQPRTLVNRLPTVRTRNTPLPNRRAAVCVAEDAVTKQLAWVDAIPVSEIQPGETYRRVLAGLDICIACDEQGSVYALANKAPPLGVPLSDGTVVTVADAGYVRCPQYGTLFDLNTGDVEEGSWISSPPILNRLLRIIFGKPAGVLTYPVRDSNGMIQTCVNINARAEYEKKYWKGLLDATGKADGGYY